MIVGSATALDDQDDEDHDQELDQGEAAAHRPAGVSAFGMRPFPPLAKGGFGGVVSVRYSIAGSAEGFEAGGRTC